jgi:hypothetical protein
MPQWKLQPQAFLIWQPAKPPARSSPGKRQQPKDFKQIIAT